MNWLRCVLVLLLGAGLLSPSDAGARTVCEADMTDLDFGVVASTSQSTTATINYECDTKQGTGPQTTVRMCLAIGVGFVQGSTESDRLMTQLFGDSLVFDMYKDSSHTQIWGGDASTPSYLQHPVISYPLNNGGNGKLRGSITVYGHIPDLWGAAAGGYFSYIFDNELSFRYNDGPNPANDPVACDSGPGQMGTDSFPFWVWADLPQRCDVRATNMNFGTISNSFRTGNLTSTSTISLECTNRMAWQVGLDNGRHFDGSSRRLCSGSTCIRYQLNRPPGDGGGNWGNVLDVNTVADTSSREELEVTGVINDQPLTQAGTYSDTITVIVTY